LSKDTQGNGEKLPKGIGRSDEKSTESPIGYVSA
jgi:hypothetical protein